MVSYVGFKTPSMGFDAHLTVVYFGEHAELEALNEMGHRIHEFTRRFGRKFFVVREELKAFGPKNDVPVVTVAVPEPLRLLRDSLAQFSASEFKDWNPHITLKFNSHFDLVIPHYIQLDVLGVY